MTAKDESARALEIRKYPNRRYYDSTHSRHLTLEEIRTLVEQGYDIRVVDAKTKADITGQVLIQIILELDTVKLDSLPVPLLVHLIRVNDQLIKNFVDNYLYKAIKAFTDYQEHWQNQMRSAQNLPGAFPNMAAWTQAMLQPFSIATDRAHDTPATAPSPPPPPEAWDLRDQIRKLQKEVSGLRRRFPSPRKAKAGRPGSRKRSQK